MGNRLPTPYELIREINYELTRWSHAMDHQNFEKAYDALATARMIVNAAEQLTIRKEEL